MSLTNHERGKDRDQGQPRTGGETGFEWGFCVSPFSEMHWRTVGANFPVVKLAHIANLNYNVYVALLLVKLALIATAIPFSSN